MGQQLQLDLANESIDKLSSQLEQHHLLEQKVKDVSSNIGELHQVITTLFKELLAAIKCIENLKSSNFLEKYLFYTCLLIASQAINLILGANLMINAHVVGYFVFESLASDYFNVSLYRMLCVVNLTFQFCKCLRKMMSIESTQEEAVLVVDTQKTPIWFQKYK